MGPRPSRSPAPTTLRTPANHAAMSAPVRVGPLLSPRGDGLDSNCLRNRTRQHETELALAGFERAYYGPTVKPDETHRNPFRGAGGGQRSGGILGGCLRNSSRQHETEFALAGFDSAKSLIFATSSQSDDHGKVV